MMSDSCPTNAWKHFLYFGNLHITTVTWRDFPVRCFVICNIDNRSIQFWERKRNNSECGLETTIPKEKGDHAEIYAIQRLTTIIQGQRGRLPVSIKLYTNASPCQDCAKELVKFKT